MKEDQIIESARKLFNKYGYKRVSMDEIANTAKVTKKTVYSYFSSKEELFKYFINEEIQNMKKVVENTENTSLPYFENVHNVICALLKYKKTRNFLSIILEEAEVFKNDIVFENLKTIDKMIQNYIKEKLVFAKEKGYIDVPDVDITAFLVYKMYIALIIESTNEGIDENKIADTLIKIIRYGIERKDN